MAPMPVLLLFLCPYGLQSQGQYHLPFKKDIFVHSSLNTTRHLTYTGNTRAKYFSCNKLIVFFAAINNYHILSVTQQWRLMHLY